MTYNEAETRYCLIDPILREIPLERAQDIVKILRGFKDGDTRTIPKNGKGEEVVVSRVFPTNHFGFRKITVERPLRLNSQVSPKRVARIEDEKGFQGLAKSKKKGAADGERRGAGPRPPRGDPQASERTGEHTHQRAGPI
jgi:hypothetical protein